MAKTTMSSSRVGDNLSLRLQTLKSYYQNEECIWDIGCDHGQLGLSFANETANTSIHLVDPSKLVIDVLNKKIKDAYISIANLFIHNIEGQRIQTTCDSNCFFIAGMGGKEIGEIIQHLLTFLSYKDQIVISPHRKILELRSLLGKLPLIAIEEKLIFEDDQYYQILKLKKGEGTKVHPYGAYSIWSGKLGQEYLKHQIEAFGHHRDVASQRYVEYLLSLNS